MQSRRFIGHTIVLLIASASLMAAVPRDIVNVVDANEELFRNFTAGNDQLIVECGEGAELPFKMSIKGNCLQLDSSQQSAVSLKVLQTCYVRCVKENELQFLFSSDLEQWKSFSDFFTGELKLTVVTEEAGTIARMELELNQRK
jgi:hypothetical protein